MPKHILVAPLCWGLGHAARCIPIIRLLEQKGCKLLLGSDGEALDLLRAEFPHLPFVELPAYRVRYSSDNMLRSIAPQLPHLLRVLQQERRALDSIISNHKIDALISDNRYGLQHPDIPCVLLSHQMNIRMPYPWLQWMFAKLNHSYWRKFDYCWIPDQAQEPSLAGELSHGQVPGANIRYIGNLSRFKNKENIAKKYDLLAVLSGPEPQRSRWEQAILEQARKLPLQIGLVQGKPAHFEHRQLDNIEIFSYLISDDLNDAILASDVILARSGYSTVMDMAQLARPKIIFVPTPGQTEHEYLAQRFFADNRCFYQSASAFDLAQAIDKVQSFNGLTQKNEVGLLEKAVDELLLL